MAEEIIVPEVTQTITEVVIPQVTPPIDLHLNPIFDYSPLWGWPLWIWIFIAFGIILLVVNMRWLRRKLIMAPVVPYLDALKGGKQEDQQTWMIGKNKSFYIQHLKYHDDGVITYFKYMVNISMWYLGATWAVGHAGGIKNIIVSDNYDQARDPVAEIGLYTAIDQYNDRHKEVLKDANGNPQTDPDTGEVIVKYPITNYATYITHLADMMREDPNGVTISSFCYFDPVKAQQFFPPNRTAGIFGGDNIRRARKMNIDQTPISNWLKFAPLGAAILVVIMGIIVTYMYTSG